MSFPPRFLDELRDRVSIVDVVGRRVKLQRRGREFVGLSPFKNEKSPSFTVVPEKGFFHCFSSGEHGDVIGFVMRTEGLSFPEAVERLAAEAGMDLPVDSPAERERQQKTAGLHDVVEAACAFFEQQLRMPAGREALAYLRGRGLTDATIARFRLGFAPSDRGALGAAMAREKIEREQLIEAGLVRLSERDGQPFDYFRGRVIFPISDRRGRVVAFGGRVLGDGQPKYLNSPDTPLFHKGRVLYGLAQAREPAHRTGELLVVEGYMDVIGLAQGGFSQAVAPLGTALTEDQIAELWRLAPEPVLCFDGDEAGQRAAGRAAERALPILRPGRSLRFAWLPAGEDPDSLVRDRGASAMREVVERAEPLVDFVWRTEMSRQPPDTPERRAGLRQRLRELTGGIADGDVRGFYENEVRARLAAAFPAAPPAAGRGPGRADRHRRGAEPPERLYAGKRPGRVAGLQRNGVLAALVNHPALLAEFDDALVHMELPEPELDSLRRETLNVAWESGRIEGGELDSVALISKLRQCGMGPVLESVLHPDVYMLAQYARPHVELDVVRRGLRHMVGRLERKRVEAHADEILRTDEVEHAGDRISAFVRENPPRDDFAEPGTDRETSH